MIFETLRITASCKASETAKVTQKNTDSCSADSGRERFAARASSASDRLLPASAPDDDCGLNMAVSLRSGRRGRAAGRVKRDSADSLKSTEGRNLRDASPRIRHG